MLKTRKRWISLLLTLAMLVTFTVPFAGSASAGTAASYNTVTVIPSFDPGAASATTQSTATVQVKFDPAINGDNSAKVEVVDSGGAPLTIAKVVYGSANQVDGLPAAGTEVAVGAKSFTLAAHVSGITSSVTTATLNFSLVVDASDVPAGNVNVHFFNPLGQFVDASTVVASASGGAVTAALVGTVPNIGSDSSGQSVTLRFTENNAGAIKGTAGTTAIKVKLPGGFKWTGTVTGDLSGAIESDPRTLDIYAPAATDNTVFDVNATVGVDDPDTAKLGDVVASLEGENSTTLTPSSFTVATYADYGVKVSIDSVKTLLAGKYDQKTDKITIEEKIPGSLVANRNLTIKFPTWVKIESLSDFTSTNAGAGFTAPTGDTTSNKVNIAIVSHPGASKAKFTFKAELNIEAGNAGDLVATVNGAGLADTTLTVAKVAAPVSATATASDVKIGVQAQAAPDITITESAAGAAVKTWNNTVAGTHPTTSSFANWSVVNGTSDGVIDLTLPSGARWTSTPTVAVTAGDIDIQTDQVKVTGDNNEILEIPIKSESLTAGTIKVTGVKLTLDRTVPEGPLTLKVKGTAVAENNGSNDYQFNAGTATSITLANVVTPADTTTSGTAVFKIGDTNYTLNGVKATLDAPPYIKSGRTLLPVRAIANAVGVSNDNIIWDPAGKVTVIKGDRVVQLTIGSSVMLVNGAPIGIEVAPEITAGRTFLPLRALAQALSANIAWDDATQTVTVTF